MHRPDCDDDLRSLREIFVEALEIPEAVRDAFLVRRCGDDHELHRRVTDLLDRNHRIGSFLQPAEFLVHGAPPMLTAGERLGDFEVEGFLARGGSGVVYRARQLSMHRAVALKVVSAVTLRQKSRERFAREARLAGRVDHPHLVTVYGSGEDQERGVLFYAMRLVEGVSLHDLMQRLQASGHPPRGQARDELVARFLDVARALAALHGRQLIHGDVKPENILLEGRSGPPWSRPAVLVDYGLVRDVTLQSTHSTVMGTPQYAAPELLLGKKVDARADVYSLGLTMYDLLAGRDAGRRTRDAGGELPLLIAAVPDIHQDLAAIVAKATSHEPRWRYRDGAAIAADLERFMAGEPVVARPRTALGRTARWTLRHPRRAITGALVAVGVGLSISLLVRMGIHADAAATRAGRCLEEGDLSELAASVHAVPAALAPYLLQPELWRLRRELMHPGGDDPLARVVSVRADEGPAEAALLAARYLERDGLEAHPVLARFLARSLERGTGTSMLVARLFVERPDPDRRAGEISSDFRARLLRVLRRGDHLDRAYALSALGGCGTVGSIPDVVDWLEERAATEGPSRTEEVRLALESLAMVVRRTHSAGTLQELIALDLHRLQHRIAVSVAAVVGSEPGPAPILRNTQADLLIDLAFAARAAEAAKPAAEIPSGMPDGVRAARLDPELRARLLTDLPRPAVGATVSYRYLVYANYGTIVGAYGAAVATAGEHRVRRTATSEGLDPKHAVLQYRDGMQFTQNRMRGHLPSYSPDPDTHLGAYFDEVEMSAERIALRPVLQQELLDVATFDFTAASARAAGQQVSARVRCAAFVPDGVEPDASFLRLGVFGVSEIELGFHSALQGRTSLSVELEVQKGNRGQFPYGGVAGINVLIDGSTAAELRITTSAVQPLMVPLRPAQGSGLHKLTLRLDRDSTTSLRIYRVRVFGN